MGVLNRGRVHVNPHVQHYHGRTVYSDKFYEITVEYLGEGKNVDDDRMKAAAMRTVAALETPGRRLWFNNWYRSWLKRHPLDIE